MRNATYHGPNQRAGMPRRNRCAVCLANAPFTVAENVHFCGKHADEWYAGRDPRKAGKA